MAVAVVTEHDDYVAVGDVALPGDDSRRPITATTLSIHANELRPGDLVDYGGRHHRITDVIRRSGSSWPIAVDGSGWAIALGQGRVSVWRG